jgi:uncharacterized protein YkuJ
MSLSHIKEMLKMLCYYNTVEMTHSFNKNGQAFLKVSCKQNTETIQLNFIQSQAIEYYDDIEEAAAVIEELITE